MTEVSGDASRNEDRYGEAEELQRAGHSVNLATQIAEINQNLLQV
jgi:hypothetical protein